MMMTDEEKRWLVVGIAMNKEAAPVLRDFIKQEMNTHYTNLDAYCSGLTPGCTLKTLTRHQVTADRTLKRLKFQNINNNLHLHGKSTSRYNYSINDPVELAKLYLPDYLAQFSAFDESLDISAILRLLGFSNPAPIFPSPNPLIPIQYSADDVRENVRNKWGHCNLNDWTEAFFKDCFLKLRTLVNSLGLPGGKEKTILDRLSDWQTKGCQLCMGHAVDQQLLSLVQQDVKDLRANLSTLQESLAQQTTEQLEIRDEISFLRDERATAQNHWQTHEEQIGGLKEWIEETKEILEKLQAAAKSFEEEIGMRLQQIETQLAESGEKEQELKSGLCETNTGMIQLQEGLAKTDVKVEKLEEGLGDTDVKTEQVRTEVIEMGDKVNKLELVLRDQRMKSNVVEAPSGERFDVDICRTKLAQHYKRTATVPTSVWSKKSNVNMQQIYTRLTWVKEERTPEGLSKPELNRYTDVFNENENGYALNRILVRGETGIGKTTFVKKMGLDWAELVDERTIDKHQDAGTRYGAEKSVSQSCVEPLRNRMKTAESVKVNEVEVNPLERFELVLAINLKEVSKYSSFRDVVCRSNIFPEEDTAMAEQLISYITYNQEKVLLVFDGYDEYRCGIDSEIYEIFMGMKLRNCCVLITTRISKADDLLGEFKAVHAEITGFSEEERGAFMCEMLGSETEAGQLERHLGEEGLFELARVPLLLLFFCTLWKKGKVNSFPETKTKLYYAIVQYVLDHNQGKSSPAHFHKIGKYEDILVEIGKVALECLLKDDHVFEFDQLSALINCEESRFIGLLQITEFSENLRPAGMVSFIHKSIQEFLAAWYITYRCVPEGDLGDLKECTRSMEDCRVFENVFQFICGLSDDGARKVLEHMASLRFFNSKLDLLKTLSGEVCIARYDILLMYETFIELLKKCSHEVQSRSEVLRNWLEALEEVRWALFSLYKFIPEIILLIK